MSSYSTLMFTAIFATACSGSQAARTHPDSGSSSPRANPATLAVEARRALLGEGVPRDRERALTLFFEACQKGDPRSCAVIIGTFMRHEEEQVPAVLDALWPRCRAGDPFSCRIASDALGSYRIADSQIRAACAGGNASACTMQAKDTSNNALFIKACDLGDPEACESVIPSDPRLEERATQLRISGCKAGYARDCYPHDEPSYRRLIVEHCLAGSLQDCVLASRSLPTERATAARILTMACALTAKSCRELADFHLEAPDRQVEAARAALEVSCFDELYPGAGLRVHSRLGLDCVKGAKLYSEAPADPTRAAAMLKRACELGESSACPQGETAP
ncbi:MAG: Sel1 family protein [Myxococcales bacterium]|nr:Sel1 family protein [Myxococcales bacterium]